MTRSQQKSFVKKISKLFLIFYQILSIKMTFILESIPTGIEIASASIISVTMDGFIEIIINKFKKPVNV